MEGSGVVASESTNIVGPKDWHEKMELALVDKLGEGLEKGKRVNRDAIGGESHKKRSRLGKGSIERGLKVQEFERCEIRGGRRGEDSRHAGGEGWRSRGGSRGTKNNELELGGREKREAVGVVVGHDVGRSGCSQGSRSGGRESLEFVLGHSRVLSTAFFRVPNWRFLAMLGGLAAAAAALEEDKRV